MTLLVVNQNSTKILKSFKICGVLRNLVPFVQFKNGTNGTKSRNTPHIMSSIVGVFIFFFSGEIWLSWNLFY